jgi:hypothetical protein
MKSSERPTVNESIIVSSICHYSSIISSTIQQIVIRWISLTIKYVEGKLYKSRGFPINIIYFVGFHFCDLLNPWSRDLLEKPTRLQLVKKFPAFYGTRRLITAFASARHLSLSWASSIQPIPQHPTSSRPLLILSSHLRLGLPSGLFPSGFPTKTLYMPLPSHICAKCPAHLIILDFIARTNHLAPHFCD